MRHCLILHVQGGWGRLHLLTSILSFLSAFLVLLHYVTSTSSTTRKVVGSAPPLVLQAWRHCSCLWTLHCACTMLVVWGDGTSGEWWLEKDMATKK
jgi:hypothetical protein